MSKTMELFILDSGAFSVKGSGATIDIEAYAEFCAKHPGISYYVSLDVIPEGRKPADLEKTCQEGWANYQIMKQHVPQHKIIPVYHYGEDVKWLDRYLDDGCSYIGFGQTGIGGMTRTRHHMNNLRSRLFNADGSRAVKTHGFAVTSFKYMMMFPWHSVDSASWVKQGGFGGVWVPHRKFGSTGWDYTRPPMVINFSPKSPSAKTKDWVSILTMTPAQQTLVREYMDEIGSPMGRYEIKDVEPGYKLAKGKELWYDKDSSPQKVLVILEKGLTTAHQHRWRANAIYMRKVNESIDVNHIYLAGSDGTVYPPVEKSLRKRLMTYHSVGKGSGQAYRDFAMWDAALLERQQRGEQIDAPTTQ
jgi:hypothetical protein